MNAKFYYLVFMLLALIIVIPKVDAQPSRLEAVNLTKEVCQIPNSDLDIGLTEIITAKKLLYLKKDAMQGNLQSAKILYSYLQEDYLDMALCWLKFAAEQGNSDYQYDLAQLYEKGKYVEQDDYKAIYWYTRAAQNDISSDDAKISLGDIYFSGVLTPKDYKKSVFWYIQASEGNKESITYGNALFKLARANQYGFGIKKDTNKALKMYQEILDLPFNIVEETINYLTKATMYENGLGFNKDLKQAVDYYFYAAIEGDKSAQFKMNELYREGKGVPQDVDMADGWLEISQLTPEQLSVSIYE